MAKPPPLPRRGPPPLPPILTPPNRPFLRGRLGESRWRAQDVEVAVGDNRELGAVDLQQLGVSDLVSSRLRSADIQLSWVPGPPTSHVHSFALWDARKLMTVRTQRGQYVVDSPSQLPPSRIYVRFRPSPAGTHKTKRRGVRMHKARNITQYVYYSPDHLYMKDTYQQMFSAAHPGRVIYDRLQEVVPYQRIY